MGYFSFPHTRTYDSDLGWLIKHLKGIDKKLDEYLENSVITFADPIQWNITTQYTALTMVVDSDGTAYLSKQPVPAGVSITNTDYWMPIFNYDDSINELRDQIAYNARTDNTTSVNLYENDLVFWNGLIYRVIADMSAGSAFIIGTNIEKYTVDEKINDNAAAIADEITNRINAVNDEATARVNAINDEITNRENADSLIRANITYDMGTSPTTDRNLNIYDMVWLNNELYRVITPMTAGTAFIVDTNVKKQTLNNRIKSIDTFPNYFFMPESYGAVGDGVTDDTAAIQAMVNAMNYGDQAVFTAKKYLIRDTIHIDVSFLSFSGGFCRSEWTPNIYTDRAITMFDVSSLGFCARDILFGGDRLESPESSAPTLIFNFNHDNVTRDGDIDAIFTNCGFGFAQTGIYAEGRNIKVTDSIFTHISQYGIRTVQTTIDTANRGYEFVRNRFHSCGTTGCVCISNEINNNGMRYYLVADNYVDFCYIFYRGYVGNAVIQDNYIARCTSTGIVCNASSASTSGIDVVSGNILQGLGTATPSAHGIDIGTDAETVIVKNNTVYYYSLNGINVRNNAKVIITGNTLRYNGRSGSARDITINPGATGMCNDNNISIAIVNGGSVTENNNYLFA